MLRIAAALAVLATVAPSLAVNVVIDYTYAPSFFSASSTNGRQARETVEAAADFFSAILDDTLAPIETPAPFVGSISTEIWSWDITFPNPVGAGYRTVFNPTIAEDEFRIYVGAHQFSDPRELGAGSFGISRQSRTFQGAGAYFPNELAAINAIDSSFNSIRTSRGETSGFVSWGGTLKFNSGAVWHYDHDTAPTSGRNDLFTAALHEMGHALGFGTSTAFMNLVNGNRFTGPKARAANGGQNPLLQDGFHWKNNDASLRSRPIGGGGLQEPAMDPSQTAGQRKLFTELDAAALDDIGWDVVAPAVSLPGDFNGDGRVDAIDYTVWRDAGGSRSEYQAWTAGYGSAAGAASTATSTTIPEPTACLLAFLAAAVVAPRRYRA